MANGARKDHDFCWINLMTRDAKAARAFYSSLFGWTYGDMPGVPGGHIILVNGRAAGALMDLEASELGPGTPPMIGVMMKVRSADATVEKVNALGGRAEPAFDVLTNGRMAVCFDPNGAQFDLWQPKSVGAAECDLRAHGAPSWFETITTDVDRVKKFYSGLFGWGIEDRQVPGMTYTIFTLDGVGIAGAMKATPQMGSAPPFWATVFTVNNADETAALAVKLGGTLCMPVMAIPDVGRFALIKSPQGVSFEVMQYLR